MRQRLVLLSGPHLGWRTWMTRLCQKVVNSIIWSIQNWRMSEIQVNYDQICQDSWNMETRNWWLSRGHVMGHPCPWAFLTYMWVICMIIMHSNTRIFMVYLPTVANIWVVSCEKCTRPIECLLACKRPTQTMCCLSSCHCVPLLLHPCRLTWNIIMEVGKMIFLSKWVIYRFHVNLPGCN